MDKKTKIIIGFVAIISIGLGGYLLASSQKNYAPLKNQAMQEKEQMEKEKMMPAEMPKEEKSDSMMDEDTKETVIKKGTYEVYDQSKLAMAENGDVVLFFHASWCPSCRGLNSDIEKNINSIPENVTILKTNYDSETELKKKYGVTYQHTLVQVDKDGNMLKKWSGGSSLDSVLSQIQ